VGGDQDIYLTDEIDDHQNVMEIAVASINGVNRVEYASSTDEASVFSTGNATQTNVAGYTLENTSSALFISGTA